MFIDAAEITVRSGKGGDGKCSFRREKFVPKGGPDGGDGGRGGDVLLVADPHLDTLLPFAHRRRFAAGDGEPGGAACRHGGDGTPCRIAVPVGCLVHDAETGEAIADLVRPGEEVLVAEGGRGGLGNDRFKNSVQQAPTRTTPGGVAVERRLQLELKLLADVGLVGLPNAGKSTFLRAISRATPKVADYPFTTLSPQLGIADLPGERRLLVADIPGLVEGAAEGAGLGHDFLRHVERTGVLIHLVDAAPEASRDPAEDYRVIRGELERFAPQLAEKPEVVVLNKADLVPEDLRDELVEAFVETSGATPTALISGATGEGIRELLEAVWAVVHATDLDRDPAQRQTSR
ncbi:MAG: GTPase ObgE [Planctomycetota bacterium]|jgi:GTP-binding protein